MKITIFGRWVSWAFVSVFLGAGTAYSGDRPSVHGMLVVGQDQVYLSHLPMFHSPHDYQAILEADLGEEGRRIYLRDRHENPDETVYTLAPEVFVLPDMIHHPRPFRAQLYRGHFERGGVKIAELPSVRIRQVLEFHPLDRRRPRDPELPDAILFGSPGDAYLANRITAHRNFDQVLSVRLPRGPVAQALFDRGALRVELPRLSYFQFLPRAGRLEIEVGLGQNWIRDELHELRELYRETDDLRLP